MSDEKLNLICPPIDLRTAWYMRHDYTNNPINIKNILTVRASLYKAYPDEEGTPAIFFDVVGRDEPLMWLFPKYSFGFEKAVELRDAVLEQIERGDYSPDFTTTQYLEALKTIG